MDINSLQSQRYSSLIQIWAHHNLTQLQWPIVIVGVVFLGLANVVAGRFDLLARPELWGQEPVLRLLAIPFLIAGLGTIAMLRTMTRARQIMGRTEEELEKIELSMSVEADCRFSSLNHPAGASGPFFIHVYLAGIIAAPSLATALCLFCGMLWGGVLSIVVLVWLTLDVKGTMRAHRRLNSPSLHDPVPVKRRLHGLLSGKGLQRSP